MLPVERQQRIKELVAMKKALKISQLSEELGVSEMTIHRDVKPLLDSGFLIKTFGGIALAPESPPFQTSVTGCVFCNQLVTERLAYRLILQDGTIEHACCAHCGILRHHQLGPNVTQAICHDFLCQTTISAYVAHFVIDAEVSISCCQPQVLSFELRDHAERFVKGFGGTIFTFEQVSDIITEKMNCQCDDYRKV